MDRGAWRATVHGATVHGIAKSWTRLSTHINNKKCILLYINTQLIFINK